MRKKLYFHISSFIFFVFDTSISFLSIIYWTYWRVIANYQDLSICFAGKIYKFCQKYFACVFYKWNTFVHKSKMVHDDSFSDKDKRAIFKEGYFAESVFIFQT